MCRPCEAVHSRRLPCLQEVTPPGNARVYAACKGRAMERLAEDRKGPGSAEHKKRQMLGALAASLQVVQPLTCISPATPIPEQTDKTGRGKDQRVSSSVHRDFRACSQERTG